ncbi:MAG: MalY/PatB family protein [Cetobacterium sp.]|uniref:MalY/PatB family protein n=1 Tax=Cetobacterium sp. TaxID=2071632 RepID=UPI003F2C7A98
MKSYIAEYVERRGTDSRKWSKIGMQEMADYIDDESLPLWVADMDFKAPKIVIDKLKERVVHGVFGYNIPEENYYESIRYWNEKRKGFEVESKWVVATTGVVPALNFAIKAYSEKGDGIIIQSPVYPPFRYSIMNNERKVIDNKLLLNNGKYEIDFEDLEKKAQDPKTKMLIMCTPHNPVGRVWSEEELRKVIDICLRNNLILVADEIHSDLILFGNKFYSIGNMGDEILEKTVICTSVSKTFNLAGLRVANILIPNEKLRDKFLKEIYEVGEKPIPNLFGAVGVEAAYSEEGEEWLESLISYLEENYNYLKDYIETNIPKIKVSPLEGTYLAWLDFREYNLSAKELKNKLEKEAKLVVDPGEIFGEEGQGFIRLNFACSLKTLKITLERLKKIFK